MSHHRLDEELLRRDIPSFIEPRPPLISHPALRPRPQKGTKLFDLSGEDMEYEDAELLQVYLRLKPCKEVNYLYEVRNDKCLITSMDTTTAGHGRRTQLNVSKMYTFSQIFNAESTQKELFEAIVKDNLKRLPEGQSFTLLTYGASGSGKTYTLMGTVSSPGLVPRSLEYVFKLIDASQQPHYKPAEGGGQKLCYAQQEFELQWVKSLREVSKPLRDKYRRMSSHLNNYMSASTADLTNKKRHYVWVSFVEIYNEAIYDLLSPPDKRNKLRIREDSSGNVYVKGAVQAFVRSGEEAYDVMVAGKHNLVVASTGIHAHSSRSHCIFTITMLTETETGIRSACVRLCDLAGCERARATGNTGARMAESRAINTSLHVLERCLHSLYRLQKQRQRQKHRTDPVVPYRESKLTRLLGSGLSGALGEAVSMVVTLNPAMQYALENKHVLSLAAVAQDIQINNTMLTTTYGSTTTINEEFSIDSSAELMRIRSDNERLHFELAQAHNRIRDLTASFDEQRKKMSDLMYEVVEETKDIQRVKYEAQISALREEMQEMAEEYENRLKESVPPADSTGAPKRYSQTKVTELMTKIADLEEKLLAEQIARARAEEKCKNDELFNRGNQINKPDNKPGQIHDIVTLSASEYGSDDEIYDPQNESLEPVFKVRLNTIKKGVGAIQEVISEDLTDNESNTSGNSLTRSDDGEVIDCASDDDNVFEGNSYPGSANEFMVQEPKTGDEDFLPITLYNADDGKESLNEGSNVNKSLKKELIESYVIENERKLNLLRGTDRQETDKTELYEHTFNVKVDDNKSFDTFAVNDEIIVNTNKLADHNINTKAIVNKIIHSYKTNQRENNSLNEFEQWEIETKSCLEHKDTGNDFGQINVVKDKGMYFEDLGNKSSHKVVSNIKLFNDVCKPLEGKPIIQDPNEFIKKNQKYFDNSDVSLHTTKSVIITEPITENTSKKFNSTQIDMNDDYAKGNNKNNFVDNFVKPGEEKLSSIGICDNVRNSSLDIFSDTDLLSVLQPTHALSNIEKAQQSIEKLVLSKNQRKENVDDTLNEFDKIYKSTTPRATQFDLLLSKDYSTNDNMEKINCLDSEIKPVVNDAINETENKNTEYIARSKAKQGRKNLRLRKKKDQNHDENVSAREEMKLKDIGNLQQEFSDITIDVPPVVKVNFVDTSSPEIVVKEENVPPEFGIKSCPSMRLTRSRRKLFTPQVEPLEESISHTGESDERIRVPRPSYCRRRARRKL